MPTATAQPTLDLAAVNAQLAEADAESIIGWAADAFGERLIMSSSFGSQAAVMLHLVTRIMPNIPVVFIDTGYLFPQTYRFAQELTQRLKLNLKVYAPRTTAAWQEALHGKLWQQGEEGLAKYHQFNKIEPMQRALRELNAAAWLAGLRAQQTEHRAALRPVELQNGLYKVHPILRWTTKDVHEYLKKHGLPYHPLYEQGYKSIGDVHSTFRVTDEPHERAGRQLGGKQECGLHLPATPEENASRQASDL